MDDLLDLVLSGAPLDTAIAKVRATLHRGDRSLVARAETLVRQDPGMLDAGLLSVDGVTYRTGSFAAPSIADLTQACQALRGVGSSRLSYLTGAGLLSDIGALQAFASHGTTFQVASQFNCLESPTSAWLVPVADYLHDPTQGPRAAVSAFPAALLRHYAAPGPDGRFTQATNAPQLDLLADVCPGRVRNGYLTFRDAAAARDLAAALDARPDALQVGVATDAEVVLGADWDGAVAGTPLITQVFTSTVAGGMYSDTPLTGAALDACRALLRGAYLGTLLAAASAGRPRVVLTLIGGGVFGNPVAAIVDAIAWAFDQTADLGLDVILNARQVIPEQLGPLADRVHDSGGVVRHLAG